ncbi:2OG-Fe(II) oxygenase [Microbulbifer harenosus]|nr:2OG-Fe(II) oxygenase [Microbulbifer harenosus]
MEFAQLQPDLQQWIRDAIKRGQSLAAMMDALLKAGYRPEIERAVQQCLASQDLADHETGAVTAEAAAEHGSATAVEDGKRFRLFELSANCIDLNDRQVEVLLAMRQPNVVLFGNLLCDWECDALIESSRPKLTPSRVVNADKGTYELKRDVRTSSGAFFQRGETPLVAAIESRLSRLLGVAESRGEPLQILHYPPGAEYRPHYDFFDPARPGNQRVLSMGGQRVGTLIIYLNDVKAGGSTVFPKIGLDILPKKGCGLFFSYADDAGGLDYQTLHGGSPVVAGEKWIATKWLRLGDYLARSD